MSEDLVFWIGGIAIAIFVAGRFSMRSRINEAEEEIRSLRNTLANEKEDKNQLESELTNLRDLNIATIQEIRKDSVLLPSLVRWAEAQQAALDTQIVLELRHKKRPARKSSDEVKLARKKARESKKALDLALNRVDLYESLAPWLCEFVDMTLSELFDAIIEFNESHSDSETTEDPASRYITQTEWNQLSSSERNQLALDRYLEPRRNRSPWHIGIQYERFIGYHFEKNGYEVEYHGATQGKKDLGIDLICKSDAEILMVQCKRLSALKEIPVREHIVAQIFGAAEYCRMTLKDKRQVSPMIVTSYILSEEARAFAQHLGVRITERCEITNYPMVKCNNSNRGGEKIYHLPMDQQYDNLIIKHASQTFYVATVAEAESLGYRRAFRWKGKSTPH